MPEFLRYPGQALFYGLFFLPLVFLTSAPLYRHQADELATLKIAVRHAGKIIGECTALTGAQVADLAANMKRLETCPRERSPLRLQLLVDGKPLYGATIPASGLHNDGVSSMYQRFSIPAGSHHLQLLMNDDQSVEEATWRLEENVDIAAGQVLVVSFKEGLRLQ